MNPNGERLKFLKSGRMWMVEAIFVSKADEVGPSPSHEPRSNPYNTNSTPDFSQKSGLHEYAAYKMRHVITFESCTGPKLCRCEVTHNL